MYFIVGAPREWLPHLRFYTTLLAPPPREELWRGAYLSSHRPKPEDFCYSVELLPGVLFRSNPWWWPNPFLPPRHWNFYYRSGTGLSVSAGADPGVCWSWNAPQEEDPDRLLTFLNHLWFEHTCTTKTLPSCLCTSPLKSVVPVMYRAPPSLPPTR